MAIHTIRMPDRLYGRDLRTIVWDDTAGTVEGDHSSVPGIAATLASPPPVDKSREGLVIFLDDPAHDPRDFLFMLADSYAAILDEPLRSTLPPVFDGIQHRAGVDWPDVLFNERVAAQSGFADACYTARKQGMTHDAAIALADTETLRIWPDWPGHPGYDI